MTTLENKTQHHNISKMALWTNTATDDNHSSGWLVCAKSTVPFTELICLDVSVSFGPVDHPLILQIHSSLGFSDTSSPGLSSISGSSLAVSSADSSSSPRTVNVSFLQCHLRPLLSVSSLPRWFHSASVHYWLPHLYLQSSISLLLQTKALKPSNHHVVVTSMHPVADCVWVLGSLLISCTA